MRQLAGLPCVHCEKPISSVIDGRFCPNCGCRAPTKCVRPANGADLSSACSACGAKAEQMQREQAIHDEDERERAELGVLRSASEWTVLLALSKKFCNPFAMRLREDLGQLEWKPGQIRILG